MTARHRAAKQRRTPRTGTLLGIIGATAVAAIAAVLAFTPQLSLPGISTDSGTAAAASAPLDLDGNRVELDPGETPAPAADLVAADTGDRLTAPAVGLDVGLGALNARDGQITPPGFTRAFTIANMGVDLDHAGDGTVYVVTHSLRGGGRAPGNYLFDTRTSTSRVHQNDEIHVGDRTYTVTASQIIDKPDLAGDQGIWKNTPSRLVLITCLQNPQGTASTANFIIEAELQDGADR